MRVLLLVLLLLTGCPTEEAPAPAGPRLEIARGEGAVDFGDVYVGDVAQQAVRIRNVGETDVDVFGILEPGGGFELVDLDELPWRLAPNEETFLTISYTPTRDEHREQPLTVVSNDQDTPQRRLVLQAEGLAPTIRIEPEEFDFGDLQVGCVNVIEHSITNVGRAPLLLDEIAFEDLAANGELTLIHSVPPGAVLPEGSAVTVEIHYVPTGVSPDTGVLTVSSNDPERPAATARVTGLGHFGDSRFDAFTVGPSGVDLLFVVDAGWSLVGVDFSPLLDALTALDSDWRLGVISTDPADSGALIGTVGPTSPDPPGSIAAAIAAADAAPSNLEGFEAARACFENAVDGCAAGFDRGDASDLLIVFVSDDQEDSSALGGVADYVNYFVNLRTDPDRVRLSDISGGVSGCSSASGSASSGSDYVAATVATGGLSGSICSANQAQNLSSLATIPASIHDTFVLDERPLDSTIAVWIGGVPQTVGWTYNAALNAIVFDFSHRPSQGDVVEVGYQSLGDCGD